MAQQTVTQLHARLASGADSDKIQTCLAISKIYAEAQPDSAVDYCNRAMRLAQKQNNRRDEALILLELGRINELHHHADLARRFTNEALSIFRTLHQPDGIAMAYDQLGLLDGLQKDITSATTDMAKAMKFYEDSHDTSGILETYHGMGAVYEQKGEIEKALTYYLRALVQYEHRAIKPEAYFVLLERIGHLYVQKGDSKTALRYLEEGVRNSNIQKDRDTEITLLDEEGKVFEKEGERVRALSAYKQALQEAKKYNRPQEEAQALINIAGILKKQNAQQSLADLKQALKIASDLHQPKLEANIYQALASVYQQQKDYKEAMEALEEHHRLLDSLLGADTTKDIAELDSSYALESQREKVGQLQQVNKKESNEISLGIVILAAALVILVLLYFYARKVNRLNRELQASNKIKDTLFSVIGHDLKGPAGSAAQLFGMMEDGDFSEEELRVMLSELRAQTTASFDLLNSLFEWGRSQLQGVRVQPEVLNSKSIINKNITLLSQQAGLKNINITDDTPADTKVFADPNHFDFIIRNLLSNAIKFTYIGGHIFISSTENDKEMIFGVRDTGIGISELQQKAFLKSNLSVSFGTGGEKGSGLGLLLIKEFMIANHGRIWLQSKEGEGTTFYFSFPKK
ncbi:tetratricopeptide repeat-containing sensor histidine kinase [Mucilaginibacter mali]|uniref:histidine kinase n=1 Tax=Mucilaginibacter mali TaxID=2740462 RepID=A0A7D4Q464_9SPHI|nr:tetratricopeptide repeat protein [Mucilaginibacter mali]QKJ32746.1 tetratricopeptide repeat-containing sensor histidine kinase [Mucilaginibacter mali]